MFPSDTVIIEGFKLGIGFVFAIVTLWWAREDRKDHKAQYEKIIEEQGKRNERLIAVLDQTQSGLRDLQEIVRDLIQYDDIKETIRGNNRSGGRRQ